MKKMSVLSVTAWAGVFGAIFIAIYGHFTCGLFIPDLSMKAMASFAYIVWLGGVGAMIFWNIGVKCRCKYSFHIFKYHAYCGDCYSFNNIK